MKKFGRAMQVGGLVLLPVAMLMQLMNQLALGAMLTMMIAGVAAFYLGRYIEGYAPR
ncbi:MAG: hypothetical protein K8T25_06070 [Planctomycetia bacterium]|nr:hypothetical protein [Planctomycetia bacterium]